MRVGITGGTGFLGSHVARALRRNGFEVTVSTREFTGDNDGADTIVDVRDQEAVTEFVADVDVVVHLAGVVGVGACDQRPEKAFNVNVIGAENVAWACRTHRTPLTFASSVSVIGVPEYTPVDHRHPRDPDTLYGRTKAIAETAVEQFAEGAYPSHLLRFTNVYGQFDDGVSSAVDLFLKQATSGEPITVHKPGTQKRDFVFVEDVVNAVVRSVQTLNSTSATGAEVMHIGAGESVSVVEAAECISETVASMTSNPVPVQHCPNPDDRKLIEAFCITTGRSHNLIGYTPEYTLSQGIKQLLQRSC